MKKLLFIITLLLAQTHFAYAGITFYERTDNNTNQIIQVSFDDIANFSGYLNASYWCVEVFNSTLDVQQSGTGDIHNIPVPVNTTSYTFEFNNLPLGEYTGVYLFTSLTANCTNASAVQVFELLEGDSFIIFTVTNDNPFSTVISEGDNVMTTVTGENMQANVSYAGNTFYKPFMGAGLSILYYLRYWIVALVIIGAIVFFYKRYNVKNV